ncbi:MAG: hypothetical protein IT385_20525 [Deltaproteobacteria bacterium]|nr:hypothetical protein [Deltaproteobacteria bacterium]
MTNDPSVTPAKKSSRVGSASTSSSAQALLGAAPAEQIAAAIAAEKWARAADLLTLNGERLLLDGEQESLVGWLAALPAEHIQKNAKLATLYAWSLVYLQRYQEALTRLSLAERSLQAMKLADAAAWRGGEETSDELELHPHAELEQSIAAVRAHLASVTGDHAKIPKSVEQIMLPASADHPCWRAAALITLGRCRYLAGDLRGAREDLESALTLASHTRGARAERIATQAAVLLGRVATARGSLTEASRHYEPLLASKDPEARAAAAVGQAEIALLRHDREAARAALAVERPAGADPIAVTLESGIVSAYLAALDGQHDEARTALEALEKHLAGMNLRWPGELLQAHRARLALLRGDDSAARRWLQGVSLSAQKHHDRMSPIGAFQIVTKALVELRTDAAAALQSAARALAFGEETGHRVVHLEALVLTGLASHVLGKRDDARSALVAALESARPEGIARPFLVRLLDEVMGDLGLDDPQAMALREAAKTLPTPHSTRERAFTPRPGQVAPGPIETKQATGAEPTAPSPTAEQPAAPPQGEASATEPR